MEEAIRSLPRRLRLFWTSGLSRRTEDNTATDAIIGAMPFLDGYWIRALSPCDGGDQWQKGVWVSPRWNGWALQLDCRLARAFGAEIRTDAAVGVSR